MNVTENCHIYTFKHQTLRFILVVCRDDFRETVRELGRKSANVTEHNVNKSLNHHLVHKHFCLRHIR